LENALASLHDSLSPTQQLLLLKDFTKKTGVIHEAQAMQLRLWPFTIDPTIDSAEAEVDFETKKVTYQWVDSDKPEGWKPDARYKRRLEALDKSIKEILLGHAWKMEVQMNGSSIFSSGDIRSARKQRSKSKRKQSKQRSRRAGRR
jgi:hypothetical protein